MYPGHWHTGIMFKNTLILFYYLILLSSTVLNVEHKLENGSLKSKIQNLFQLHFYFMFYMLHAGILMHNENKGFESIHLNFPLFFSLLEQ